MKSLTKVLVVMALTLAANTSIAAVSPIDGPQPILSALIIDGGSSVLINNHGEKLSADNHHSYPMTSVSGQHNMHKTSVVYD